MTKMFIYENENAYMRQYMVVSCGVGNTQPNAFFPITGENNRDAMEEALAEFDTRIKQAYTADDTDSEYEYPWGNTPSDVILFLITEDRFGKIEQKLVFWPESIGDYGPYKPAASPIKNILD